MYYPIRLFGLVSEKQLIFKTNIQTDKFKFDSVDYFNNLNEKINFKEIYKTKNKNFFCELYALYNGGINYLTYKMDDWYSVKFNDYNFLLDQMLIFDISAISQKYSNKVSNIDYTEVIVDDGYDCLIHKNTRQLGKRMLTYWKTTRDIYPYSTNIEIDRIYSDAILFGAYGCSVDDNFLVVLSDEENKYRIIDKLKEHKIESLEWSF